MKCDSANNYCPDIIKSALFLFRCIVLIFFGLKHFPAIMEILDIIPHEIILFIDVTLELMEKILRIHNIKSR